MKKSIFTVVLYLTFSSLNAQVLQPPLHSEWEKEMREAKFRAGEPLLRDHKKYERVNEVIKDRLDDDGRVVNYARRNMDAISQVRSSFPTSQTHEWHNIGPGFYHVGMGRVNCMAFIGENTWLAGTAGGGLWKTDCAGTLICLNEGLPGWYPLTDQLPVLSISGVTFNPGNPDEIYILTGDGDGSVFSDWRVGAGIMPKVPSIGILKTNNGGQTWEQTSVAFDVQELIGGFELLTHPTQPNRMYAATSEGLYFTNDSWQTFDHILPENIIYDIAFSPYQDTVGYFASHGKIYSFNLEDPAACEIILQTNSNRMTLDVGKNFVFNDTEGIIYAAVVTPEGAFGKFFSKSESDSEFELVRESQCADGNSPNYINYDTGDCSKGQGQYNFRLKAHPTIPQIVYMGGVTFALTVNGGIAWDIFDDWTLYQNEFGMHHTPNDVHADVHFMDYNPFNGDFVIGCDGGVYVKNSGGWTARNHNLAITQFYHMDIRNLGVVIEVAGGAQDNGTMNGSPVANSFFGHVNGGDGFSTHLANIEQDGAIYSQIQYGKLRIDWYNNVDNFFDGGDITPPDAWNGGTDEYPNGAWDTPFAMDPSDNQNIIAGYEKLYWSGTDGESWITIFNPQTLDTYPFGKFMDAEYNSDGTSIACTVQRSDSTGKYRVFWAENQTQYLYGQFTDITPPGLNRVSNIFFNDCSSEYKQLVLCIPGYSEGNKVWIYEGDSVWVNITFNLPNVPALSGTCDEYGIYIGTDIGVFYKYNSSDQWTLLEGLPSVPVTQIKYANEFMLMSGSKRNIYLSTYGRGIWKTQAAVPDRRTRWYVDLNATGDNTGESWEHAFTNLSDAKMNALQTDSLWVAQGVYGGANGIKGLYIFGGFNATEDSLHQRNPELYVTTFSGFNSSHALNVSSFSLTALIDGVTIRDGFSSGNGGGLSYTKGGCMSASRIILRNVKFVNNHSEGYGGAIFMGEYAGYKRLHMYDCTFEGNSANRGGAIYLETTAIVQCVNSGPQHVTGTGAIDLEGCTFINNTAVLGGAIFNDARSLNVDMEKAPNMSYTMKNCTFVGNTATTPSTAEGGGAVYNRSSTGATNYIAASKCAITYENCHFEGNTTNGRGGAIYHDGEVFPSHLGQGLAKNIFYNCTFTENHGGWGGGALHVRANRSKSHGIIEMHNCTLSSNTSQGGAGGAVFITGEDSGRGDILFKNSEFISNRSFTGNGGVIYGEAFVNGDINFNADSCYFFDNKAYRGGALYFRSATSGTGNVDVHATHSQFVENIATQTTNPKGGGAVAHDNGGNGISKGLYEYCLFEGNSSHMSGSAVLFEHSADGHFRHCDFNNNQILTGGRGALFYSQISSVSQGQLKVDTCRFDGNISNSEGAAIYVTSGSSLPAILEVNGSVFEGNTATNSSCIRVAGTGLANVKLIDTEFLNNICTQGQGSSNAGAVRIWNSQTTDLLVENCLFEGNNGGGGYGGGLFLNAGGPTGSTFTGNVHNSVFRGNTSDYAGGVYLTGSNFQLLNFNMTNCLFENNVVTRSTGAFRVLTGKSAIVNVSNCDFIGNQQTVANNSSYHTGALYFSTNNITTDSLVATISDCRILNNSAGGTSAGVITGAGGITRVNFERCLFEGNSAGAGGGVLRATASAYRSNRTTFRDCFFMNNTAGGKGGAFLVEGTTTNADVRVTLDQCVIANNQGTHGGALSVNQAAWGSNLKINILNSTLFGNNATTLTGGILGERTQGTQHIFLANNIIYGNTDPSANVAQKQVHKIGTITAEVLASVVQDGIPATYTDLGGNFGGDPLFVDSENIAGPDGICGTEDDGLMILGLSSAVNIADGAFSTDADITGHPRPELGGYDAGAYEMRNCNDPLADSDGDGIPDCFDNCPEHYNPSQSDWNNDGIGDACQDSDGDGLSDELELANGFDPSNPDSNGDGCSDYDTFYGLCPTSNCVADLNGDGVVNFLDLNLMLTNFGCVGVCLGDLNNDGLVNFSDLNLMLSEFGCQ